MRTMRPFQSTISIDEARRIIRDAVRPIERVERVALAESRGRVLATSVQATADVPPFSRAAMDGYAVIAADLAGASRATPASLDANRARLHRPGAGARRDIRHVRRSGHRRADAGGRGRRGDGRGNGGRGRRRHHDLRRRPGGSEHRPAGTGHPRRAGGAGGGHRAQRQPHRRPGCGGPDQRGGVRAPAGRDSLDRQRDRGAWHGAWPRAALRHQQLHALHRGGRARLPAAGGAERGRHDRGPDARDRRVSTPRRACTERRQLGRHPRPGARRAARQGRGAVSRHRGEARQADGVRADRLGAWCSACPATPRPVCRTPTS